MEAKLAKQAVRPAEVGAGEILRAVDIEAFVNESFKIWSDFGLETTSGCKRRARVLTGAARGLLQRPHRVKDFFVVIGCPGSHHY